MRDVASGGSPLIRSLQVGTDHGAADVKCCRNASRRASLRCACVFLRASGDEARQSAGSSACRARRAVSPWSAPTARRRSGRTARISAALSRPPGPASIPSVLARSSVSPATWPSSAEAARSRAPAPTGSVAPTKLKAASAKPPSLPTCPSVTQVGGPMSFCPGSVSRTATSRPAARASCQRKRASVLFPASGGPSRSTRFQRPEASCRAASAQATGTSIGATLRARPGPR